MPDLLQYNRWGDTGKLDKGKPRSNLNRQLRRYFQS
jgi:hypothetical protein